MASIFNENQTIDRTIDEAKNSFYTKEEMETVLAPITNSTTAINTELDDFETDLDNKLNKDGVCGGYNSCRLKPHHTLLLSTASQQLSI